MLANVKAYSNLHTCLLSGSLSHCHEQNGAYMFYLLYFHIV